MAQDDKKEVIYDLKLNEDEIQALYKFVRSSQLDVGQHSEAHVHILQKIRGVYQEKSQQNIADAKTGNGQKPATDDSEK